MNQRERQLLQEEIGAATPDLCIRSKARIDAGLWWWRSPMWLCVVGDELVMLAIARRRYFARMPLAECADSHYNHATGEFVIEPGEDLKFSQFPIPPRDALKLLEYFKKTKTQPLSPTT
ncbi:MAG: hypothetical protein AB8F34_09565 [Akkermansiaceae bacterium]